MNHKHEALWPLKHCKLYILCTLILFNPFHLTIGSTLILTQNELWIPKCCANSKVFFIVFRLVKGCHQDFSLLCIIILVTSPFLNKSGSLLVCFHPLEQIFFNLWSFKHNFHMYIFKLSTQTQRWFTWIEMQWHKR